MQPSTERPIRIRFVHTRYPHWGGHSGYVQFVRLLDPARFRSAIHASADNNTDLPSWIKVARPLLKPIAARSGMAWYKLSDLHAEMTAFASCMAGRSDLVHFLDGEHSGRFLPRALKAAGRAHKKTIATFHQPPEFAKDLLHPPALRQLDQVVLVSPTQIPFFREHVAEERLSVILHGVDTDFFHPASSANSTEQVRCITVGRWLRDWVTFANVARSLPDIRFDVVSNQDLGIGHIGNVHVHQNLSDAQLASLYRQADILFLPLLQSTANNALLEGLASGLAVVATDLDAIRAYVPNGDAILTTGGTDEFVSTIRSLQRDVGLRHRMQSKARARAESLAWPNLVRRYEALYSKLGSR